MRMDCPVCQHKNINSLIATCPNCKSNLLAIKMLAAIEDQYIDLVKSNVDLDGNLIQQKKNLEAALRKKNKRNNWLLFFLFLIPLLSYFYFNRTPDIIEKKVVVNNDSLSIYKEQLLRTQTKNMELSRQIKAIEGTRKVRQLKYVIKEGDILNDLGKLFYNDSLAWYQIAIDNHIYDVRGLPIGDTLIMNYRE